MALTLTPLTGIPYIRPGDDLSTMIFHALESSSISLQDDDILVLAQKIVSKAEGRLVNLNTIKPSSEALELADKTGKDPRLVEVILQESNEVLRTRPGTIIVEHRLGFVCASAGVDHSNVCLDPPVKAEIIPEDGGYSISGGYGRSSGYGISGGSGLSGGYNPSDWVLLLPEDPDASAQRLRLELETASGKHLGVMIIDSHGRAWRMGTVGIAIGLSGLPGLVDLRGQPDLSGFLLKITQVAAADELAAAASLVMGQAAEGTPVIHIRGFPYPLREGKLRELLRPRPEDMFR